MNPALPVLSIVAALSAADNANLQAVVDEYRESQEVPGVSAVVIKNNQIIYAGASGVADLATGRELSADPMF